MPDFPVFGRWKLILRYLPAYRAPLIGGALALVLGNVCSVAAPLYFREGVRAIEVSGENTDLAQVAWFGGAAVLIGIFGAIFAFLKRNLLMRTSRHAETDLRRDLFRHLLSLPVRFFDRMRTGDLMSRATADIETARMAIGPAAMYLADAVLGFGMCLAVMLKVNPGLTAYLLLPLAGISAGLFWLAPRIQVASRAVQDQLARISARTQESFAGGRVVKTFATEEFEQAALDGLGRVYLEANLKLARVRGLTAAWLTLMSGIGLAMILVFGTRQVIDGTFDIGGMLLFSSYMQILVWPMMAIGWVLTMVQRGAAGIARISDVMAERPEPDVDPDGSRLQGGIEIRDLDFTYDDAPILKGIRAEVPAGTTLGIVGRTGSGKSTLLRLLARLYDPPPGTVFVDGRDVHDIPLGSLRESIAFVPQEAFLFSATIRENIAFGANGSDSADVEGSADLAHLRDDLAAFPHGIDTTVGERGVTLSGGQKQRVALARALASDAPILVLDDALSAVDSGTETAILANLRRGSAGRTRIIVAHRVSAVRDSDRILYLEEGVVTESGTHDELIALDGAYARLARAQELEAEIEAME